MWSYPGTVRRANSRQPMRPEVELSTTLKNSLYDSYKLAIRWASDRIGNEGIVIAFVTNGSFIDGNAECRSASLPSRRFFPSVCVQPSGKPAILKANARGRREARSLAQVPARLWPSWCWYETPRAQRKVPDSLYKDIGDYLSREEKLRIVRESGSIASISDWQRIAPDEHHDWLDQRDPDVSSDSCLWLKKRGERKNSKA